MTFDFKLDDRKEIEDCLWSILADFLPQTDNLVAESVESSQLFSTSVAKQLGRAFIQDRKQTGRGAILTPDQMFGIASEKTSQGRLQAQTDIDEVAGVYVFVEISGKVVLKVGQSENLRDRISKAHLRHGYHDTTSKLIDHCQARWEWPQCISEREIAAVLFPMPGSCEVDRMIIELSLQEVLSPEMK